MGTVIRRQRCLLPPFDQLFILRYVIIHKKDPDNKKHTERTRGATAIAAEVGAIVMVPPLLRCWLNQSRRPAKLAASAPSSNAIRHFCCSVSMTRVIRGGREEGWNLGGHRGCQGPFYSTAVGDKRRKCLKSQTFSARS